MIAYDLRCGEGHVFEVWFKNHEAYEDQRAASRVECPRCGSRSVEMAWTRCSLKTDRSRDLPRAHDSLPTRIARWLERHFEDVGSDFADEARRIHYGEADKRNIRGSTSEEEERELRDEGIEFVKLPLPKLDS